MKISSKIEEDYGVVGREAIEAMRWGINYPNWAFLGIDSRVI